MTKKIVKIRENTIKKIVKNTRKKTLEKRL